MWVVVDILSSFSPVAFEVMEVVEGRPMVVFFMIMYVLLLESKK